MASTSGSSAARAMSSTHAVERLVGVVQEHVLLAEDGEDVVRLAQRRNGVGLEGLVAQGALVGAR